VYIGDLLSWVMGRAQMDNAWITIMSNVNVIAVATLADTSCVVLAEGVAMPEELVQTAEAKDVNILSSAEPIYETAVKLAGLLS
jgi:serine kinase of HPr protein (carbohydrate metabolism regulator)